MWKEEDPIFGDSGFELSIEDVAEIRELTAKNVRVHEEMLADEDKRVRVAAQRGEAGVKERAAFFDEHDNETILKIALNIFEMGKALEDSGTTDLELAAKVEQEMPEVITIYDILRKNPWGYRLGQTVMAAAFLRHE